MKGAPTSGRWRVGGGEAGADDGEDDQAEAEEDGHHGEDGAVAEQVEGDARGKRGQAVAAGGGRRLRGPCRARGARWSGMRSMATAQSAAVKRPTPTPSTAANTTTCTNDCEVMSTAALMSPNAAAAATNRSLP